MYKREHTASNVRKKGGFRRGNTQAGFNPKGTKIYCRFVLTKGHVHCANENKNMETRRLLSEVSEKLVCLWVFAHSLRLITVSNPEVSSISENSTPDSSMSCGILMFRAIDRVSVNRSNDLCLSNINHTIFPGFWACDLRSTKWT